MLVLEHLELQGRDPKKSGNLIAVLCCFCGWIDFCVLCAFGLGLLATGTLPLPDCATQTARILPGPVGCGSWWVVARVREAGNCASARGRSRPHLSGRKDCRDRMTVAAENKCLFPHWGAFCLFGSVGGLLLCILQPEIMF